MLEIVSGIPGSNKSLYMTSQAIKALKRGRPVFSSYPIQFKKGFFKWSKYVHSCKLTKEMLRTKIFPEGSLLIIDEGHDWFGSREWKNFKKEDIMLFTQHRHLGYDMMIGTQHPQRIDTVLREIANMFWIVDRYFLFTVLTGYYEYSHYGLIGPMSKDIPKKRKILWFRSRYYTCYDDHYQKDNFKDRDIVQEISWEYRKINDRRFDIFRKFFKKIQTWHGRHLAEKCMKDNCDNCKYWHCTNYKKNSLD